MSNVTVDLHAHAIVPEALIEMQRAQPDYGPVLIEDGGRQHDAPQQSDEAIVGLDEPAGLVGFPDQQRHQHHGEDRHEQNGEPALPCFVTQAVPIHDAIPTRW